MSAKLSISLEDVLTGAGFADTDASPLQRAITRAAEGRPLCGVLGVAEMQRYFGCVELPPVLPTIVALICGVRGGKSLIAACAGIHAALTADLSRLKKWELPRVAIVGPRTDTAAATFHQLKSLLQNSTVLRRFIDGDPTSDTVVIRRPDGRRVEICVVPASKGGATLRNRWLVGAIFEELAQIGAEDEGASVTAEELTRAAVTRLLQGQDRPEWHGQVWYITSPFGPTGLAWETYKNHFGKPGRVLVVHAPTRALNPTIPQSEIDALAATQPDVAAREYGAEWVDADSAYLGAALVDRALRDAPLERVRGRGGVCSVGADFGTRGNATTLAVAWAEQRGTAQRPLWHTVVGGAWQWVGSKAHPLSPKAVLSEMAGHLRRYGVRRIRCDGWSFDAMRDHARDAGLELVQTKPGDQDAAYASLKALLSTETLELPPVPEMRADLIAIRQKATSGGVRIVLPRTANGRHCDFAPSVALAAAGAQHGRHIPQQGTVYGRADRAV